MESKTLLEAKIILTDKNTCHHFIHGLLLKRKYYQASISSPLTSNQILLRNQNNNGVGSKIAAMGRPSVSIRDISEKLIPMLDLPKTLQITESLCHLATTMDCGSLVSSILQLRNFSRNFRTTNFLRFFSLKSHSNIKKFTGRNFKRKFKPNYSNPIQHYSYKKSVKKKKKSSKISGKIQITFLVNHVIHFSLFSDSLLKKSTEWFSRLELFAKIIIFSPSLRVQMDWVCRKLIAESRDISVLRFVRIFDER